jgi:hypothetical protein
LALVKARDQRLEKDFGKQQTLCHGTVAQAKASLVGGNLLHNGLSPSGGFSRLRKT